jgi:hypothetical protein
MGRYEIILEKVPSTPPKKRVSKKSKNLSNSVGEAIGLNLRTVPMAQPIRRERNHRAFGLRALADSMTQPIRQGRNYRSLARQMFRVESLPWEALPLYDLVSGQESYVIDEDGQQVIPIPRGQGNRGLIPIFEVALNPRFPLHLIEEHNLIERVQELAIQELSSTEEMLGLSLLERVTSNNVLNEELSRGSLIDIFNSFESNGLRVANLCMSPLGYADLRRQFSIHAETNPHFELRGTVWGTVFGAQINVSRAIPPGVIYATADPQFLGIIPQRQEINILNADVSQQETFGFSIFEQIGMACLNPRGAMMLSVNGEVAGLSGKIVKSGEVEKPKIVMPRLNRYALLLRQGHE